MSMATCAGNSIQWNIRSKIHIQDTKGASSIGYLGDEVLYLLMYDECEYGTRYENVRSQQCWTLDLRERGVISGLLGSGDGRQGEREESEEDKNLHPVKGWRFLAISLPHIPSFILICSHQVWSEKNDIVCTLVEMSTLDQRYWSKKTMKALFTSLDFLCPDVWPGDDNK